MKRKRLKALIMSAVILSTIAASGCSTDNSASKSESEAVNGGLTVSSDSTTSKAESKSDSSVASSDSKTESAESSKSVEESNSSENSDTSETEWKETAEDSVKYVSVDCYSRKNAILGAETVKLYSANEKVEVVAITDTGYCKLKDGTFIHSDYLSDSKVTVTTATTAQPTDSKPAVTGSTKSPADVPPASTTEVTTTSKPKETTATTKAPAPVPSTPSAAVSGYTWVIEPSYDYDDVEILMNCEVNPSRIMGEDEISIPYGYTYKIAKVTPTPDDPYTSYMYEPGGRINGIFVVTTNGKKYAVDSSGKKIVDKGFDYITNPYGLIAFSNANDDKCYSLDDNGKLMEVHDMYMHNWGIFPELVYDLSTGVVFRYDYGGIRDNDYEVKNATVIYSAYINDQKHIKEKVKVGVYRGNEFIVPCEYDGCLSDFTKHNCGLVVTPPADNRLVFYNGNKIYIFDDDGICYSDGIYDKPDNNQGMYYFNGYLPVCKDGKWGLIDVNGNEVLTCQFEDITSVYDGKAWAKQNGKWGVIELA